MNKIFFATTLLLISTVSSAKKGLMYKWFDSTECSTLKIQSKKIEKTINDVEVVKNIINRINALPAEGDKMKSFGPDVELITLTFKCADGKSSQIEIYNGGFKTPSTGFNTTKSAAEISLYEDIQNVIAPALGKKLLKAKGLTYDIGSVTVTYEGTDVREQKAGEPSVGTTYKENFAVKDGEKISIHSGQTPPQPTDFKAGFMSTYTIRTYQDSTGNRLDPIYFTVTKK